MNEKKEILRDQEVAKDNKKGRKWKVYVTDFGEIALEKGSHGDRHPIVVQEILGNETPASTDSVAKEEKSP